LLHKITTREADIKAKALEGPGDRMGNSADVLAIQGIGVHENLRITIVQDLERVELEQGLAFPNSHGDNILEMVDQHTHVTDLVGRHRSESQQELPDLILFEATAVVPLAQFSVKGDDTSHHLIALTARKNNGTLITIPYQASRDSLFKLPELWIQVHD
jgi:hypothetical protein